MSDIDQFNETLCAARKLHFAIADSKRIIITESEKLKEMEVQYSALKQNLLKLAERMDVVQRGNFGWEPRFVNFLMEINLR